MKIEIGRTDKVELVINYLTDNFSIEEITDKYVSGYWNGYYTPYNLDYLDEELQNEIRCSIEEGHGMEFFLEIHSQREKELILEYKDDFISEEGISEEDFDNGNYDYELFYDNYLSNDVWFDNSHIGFQNFISDIYSNLINEKIESLSEEFDKFIREEETKLYKKISNYVTCETDSKLLESIKYHHYTGLDVKMNEFSFILYCDISLLFECFFTKDFQPFFIVYKEYSEYKKFKTKTEYSIVEIKDLICNSLHDFWRNKIKKDKPLRNKMKGIDFLNS